MAKPPITAEEPLLAEIKAFLQSVRDRSRPVVSLEDGGRALELGLAILAGNWAARGTGSGWEMQRSESQIAEVKVPRGIRTAF